MNSAQFFQKYRHYIRPVFVGACIGALLILWFQDYVTYRYIAPPGTDPAAHISLAQAIIENQDLVNHPYGYPPGFHIFISQLSLLTGVELTHILIFLPLLLIAVLIPLTFYFLLKRVNVQLGLLFLPVYVLFSGGLNDFYLGGQAVELATFLVCLLVAHALLQKNYVLAFFLVISVALFHHLTIFPLLLLLFLLLVCFFVYKVRHKQIEKSHALFLVGFAVLALIIGFSWQYYADIMLGTVGRFLPKRVETVSQMAPTTLGINLTKTTVSRNTLVSDIQAMIAQWRAVDVLFEWLFFIGFFFVIKDVLLSRQYKSHSIVSGFFVLWVVAEILLFRNADIDVNRLLRQTIIPAFFLVTYGLWRIWLILQQMNIKKSVVAFVLIVGISAIIPSAAHPMAESWAQHRYVALNNSDYEALQYLRSQPLASHETILSPSLYAPWLDVYFRHKISQAIIRPRINGNETHIEFWKILDSDPQGLSLIQKYHVRYIYLGHTVPDVPHAWESFDEKKLLGTKLWKKIFEDGEVKIFLFTGEIPS